MSTSLMNLLKSGPPAPRVVLLPDAMFFTRSIALPAGASATDVAGQVELALETLSPFPPAQLYHGYYWPAGADRVLVFAAYRRRFTTEQVAEWDQAELVIPTFAAVVPGGFSPGTTLLVPSADGITAIAWNRSPVPEKVKFLPLPPGASDADRERIREELAQGTPSNQVVALPAPPVIEAGASEREFAFATDGFASRLPAAEAGSLDVRDKEALATLRRGHARDLALWRGFIGLLVLLLLLAIGEVALAGGKLWLKARVVRVDAQRPVVEKIMTAQNLTTRINELSSKRLLPFAMIAVVTEKKPEAVTFVRTSTNGLYGLTIEAYASAPDAVSAYQAALKASPAIENVEVRDQRTRDNQMSFTVVVTFRPDALKPAPGTP